MLYPGIDRHHKQLTVLMRNDIMSRDACASGSHISAWQMTVVSECRALFDRPATAFQVSRGASGVFRSTRTAGRRNPVRTRSPNASPAARFRTMSASARSEHPISTHNDITQNRAGVCDPGIPVTRNPGLTESGSDTNDACQTGSDQIAGVKALTRLIIERESALPPPMASHLFRPPRS